jgi:ribosomal protein S27E
MSKKGNPYIKDLEFKSDSNESGQAGSWYEGTCPDCNDFSIFIILPDKNIECSFCDKVIKLK